MKGKDGHPCRGELVLDHIDNNPENNPFDGFNWQILCRGHNARKNHRGKSRFYKSVDFGGKCIRMRERRMVKSMENSNLPVSGISAELKKSQIAKPKFIRWIFRKIRKDGRIDLEEAINGGAHVVNCAQTTVRRYIMALVSRAGPLKIVEEGERKYIVFKKAPIRNSKLVSQSREIKNESLRIISKS